MTDAKIARLILYGWMASMVVILAATLLDHRQAVYLAALGWAGIVYVAVVTWGWSA